MVVLQKIELTNFLSHSDTILEIKPDQKLLIDGLSGSGKSSIVEALIWCFYGKARTTNRALIKSGTASASVTVVLEDDGISYRIVRSISNKGKHELEIYEKEGKAKTFKPIKVTGIKNLQEHLERQILRSSYLLFINSIVYPQENLESFVRQPAAKRKDIILEIIKAADYDEYLDKAKEILNTKRVGAEVNKSKLEDKYSFLASSVETSSKLEEYKKQYEDKAAIIEALEAQLKGYTEKSSELKVRSIVFKEKLAQMDQIKKSLAEYKQTEESLNYKLGELKSLNISELKSKLAELPKLRDELEKLYQQFTSSNEWNQKMMALIKTTPGTVDYDAQIDYMNKQIIEVMKEEVSECPELAKACPILVDKKQKRISQMDTDVKKLKEDRSIQELEQEEHRKKIEALGLAPLAPDTSRIEAVKTTIRGLEASELKLKEYEVRMASLASLEADISQVAAKITAFEDELAKVTTYVSASGSDEIAKEERELAMKVDATMVEKSAATMELNDATVRVTLASEALRKIEKANEDIETLTKENEKAVVEMEALESIKEALGPNGIRAIVIDLIIPQLENKINTILSKLSEFRVRLDTQKSGVGDKTVLEGLFINIINDQGEEFDFESYSGGERLKIIVSISEALSEVQKIGFRILDELFIGLDEESTEKFAVVMTSLQEKFQQMVCISHLRGIKDLFEDKVTVTKINGTSKIT